MSVIRAVTPPPGGEAFFRIWDLALVLGVCLVLAGCASAGGPRTDPPKYEDHQKGDPNAPPPLGLPYLDPDLVLAPNDVIGLTYFTGARTIESYPLQVGDTLLLEFHQQEHLNRNLIIPPDGMISIPYLPAIKAAGRSVNSLSQQLTALYKESAIFNDVQVTVSIITFNTRLKELQTSIINSIRGQTKDQPINNDGYLSLPLAGRVWAAGVTLGELTDNIRGVYRTAMPGVDVEVELRQIGANYLYVLGEVNSPGMVQIDGPMGATQAIAGAGGFRPGADLGTVAVLRSGVNKRPLAQLVNVRKILSEGVMSEDVLVRRFDVVYVPPAPIQQMNEAIMLYIRNMMPVETFGNIGFSYMWGDTNSNKFQPF